MTRFVNLRSLFRFSLILAMIPLGCSGPGTIYRLKPAADLVWPRQAEGGPRVFWVKSITDYQDAGIGKGFWKRAMELFTGAGEERIVRPHGVLFDGNERLFIADPGKGVVHCMDIRSGRYTLIRGKEGAPLQSPIGLAEDEADNLYITDSSGAAVYRYDIKKETLMPFMTTGLKRPTGLAFSEVNKFLYIVDTTAGQVVAVDTNGKERKRFGSSGEGVEQFNHPTDIAVDDLGQLYITDALNFKIKVFTPEGDVVSRFGTAGDAVGNLFKPKGVAVDSGMHIYVSDAMLDVVQVFDNTGRLLLSFGGTGTEIGQFWMPSGLYIDRHNYIFVADTYNRRIQVFRFVSGGEPGQDAGKWLHDKK